MADTSKAIEALRESRPPATDRFTYLTLIEQFLSPEILPTLNDILQDADLTSEIGWDLVEMLIPLEGAEPCLETVARLGNPRECIIKTLEVVEGLDVPAGGEQGLEDLGAEGSDEEKSRQPALAAEEANRRFITLLGMLAILHKRIKTKYPSRFLATSLLAVYKMYQPNQEQTASVLNLVHSLSGGRARPPLPQRKSSVNVLNPDQDGDASKNAPDPEAENQDDPFGEDEVQRRLLLSFTSCVLESYVNANDMSWARRLLEFYSPEKIVPGRKTATQAFREDQELLNRDAMVGKLVVCNLWPPLLPHCILTNATGSYSRLGPGHVLQDPHPRYLQPTSQQAAPEGYRGGCQRSRNRTFHRRHRLPPRILGLLVHSLRCGPTPARDVHIP